jgi:methylated-DNA-[protein]-cysteine S-methyltransferase
MKKSATEKSEHTHHERHHHAGEIRVAKVSSPIGALLVYAGETGLVALDFPGARPAEGSSLTSAKDRGALQAAAAALEDYFEKRKPLPRKLIGHRDGTPFQKKVWAAIERIPLGQTRGYGEIAAEIGHPRAARAVGSACGCNPLPLFVPCHRVIASMGKIGGYAGKLDLKRKLLRHEGAL